MAKKPKTSANSLHDDALLPFLRRTRRNKGIIKMPPLGEFLAETLTVTARLVPSLAGSLLLDDPTKKSSPLTFVAAFGDASERMVGQSVPSGEGIAGHVYNSGETYSSNNVLKDPLFFSSLDGETSFRTESVIAAPLRLENRVCGVFELVNRLGAQGFSDHDVELVELIAEYISRAILNAVDIVKQNELAYRDDLTGLRNVRGLESVMRDAVRDAMKNDSDAAVMFIDMDKLKAINDRMGHRFGSEAIRRTGKAIEDVVGMHGIPFRFGGDEFVVICPEADLDTACAMGRRIRKEMGKRTEGPMRGGGSMPALSVSIGVASIRESLRPDSIKNSSRRAQALATLGSRVITAADNALYRAKAEGRARVVKATPEEDNFGE